MYFDDVLTLLGWSLFGLIVILIWQRVAPQHWRLGWNQGEGAHKFSPLTVVFAMFLTVTVIFFFNQVWNDLTDLVPGMDSLTRYSYASPEIELQLLFIHAMFVIAMLVIALVVFLSTFKKNTAHAAVTLPYFIGSVVITCRLLYDAGSWAVRYHHRYGIYIVLVSLLAIFTFLTLYIQKWWQHRSAQDVSSSGPSVS